jgi:hypothetical protein
MLGARVEKSKMHKDILKIHANKMLPKKVKTASFYYYYCYV